MQTPAHSTASSTSLLLQIWVQKHSVYLWFSYTPLYNLPRQIPRDSIMIKAAISLMYLKFGKGKC